jgi:hypothetical protein
MKQKTMIVISAIVSTIGLYFLIKPKSKGQLGNTATRYKTINDNGFIITIPDSNKKQFDVVYIFGGMAYANPKWMYSKIPSSVFLNNVVIIAPYTSKFSSTKSKLQEIITPKGIKVGSISLIGFSAGALNVLDNYSPNYKFIGLIDPSNREGHLGIDLGKNAFMTYNQSNWGSYPRIKKDMGAMAEKIRNNGGVAESVKLSHKDIPSYFFNKFATTINK